MNKILFCLGIIILGVGFFCIFYQTRMITFPAEWRWGYGTEGFGYYLHPAEYITIYPYQTYGLILTMTGIVLTALGLLLPETKKEKLKS